MNQTILGFRWWKFPFIAPVCAVVVLVAVVIVAHELLEEFVFEPLLRWGQR